MKNVKGWLLVAIIFVAAPAIGLSLLWKDRCVIQTITSVPSPNGAWAVRIDHKDCGPAMKVATEVRLGQTGAGDGELVLLLHGPYQVGVEWRGDDAVALSPPPAATVVSRRPVHGGIAISLDKTSK